MARHTARQRAARQKTQPQRHGGRFASKKTLDEQRKRKFTELEQQKEGDTLSDAEDTTFQD